MRTEVKANMLKRLARKGQSPWYDNIDRRVIKNGKLKELFDSGILGVTSNPTIFEKAVAGSGEYDREIQELAKQGKNSREIYDILTVKDVSLAADLLRNTYQDSNHLDGYVSIEVLPEFAHNPEETIKSAREIASRIAKPNIMIKVPGTIEAPEAIRALVKEGININVTLLFSVRQYEICAMAYIDGLKDGLKEGKDIKNIFSVASIFVSRIDTKIDKMLDHFEKVGGITALYREEIRKLNKAIKRRNYGIKKLREGYAKLAEMHQTEVGERSEQWHEIMNLRGKVNHLENSLRKSRKQKKALEEELKPKEEKK